MSEVTVSTWGTRQPLPEDVSAPMHDCLWEIAQEQAVLDRMKQTGEAWETAGGKVSQQDIRKHLDVVCDDNGFRRLDGSGGGRNPNLINTGERIKVRIDPAQLDKPSPAVTNGQPSQGAYNKAVSADGGQGVDLKKKQEVDAWIESVPGFDKLSDTSKTALLTAYSAPNADHAKLATLGGSDAFKQLDSKQQQQLVNMYSTTPANNPAKVEVDKIVGAPATEAGNKKLALVGSSGFAKMDENAQKLVLDRYSSDEQVRNAIDRIVSQDNFKDKNGVEQAHALDILARYSRRKAEGYGEVEVGKRTEVLVKLYDNVLSTPGFNLNHVDPSKKESDPQTQLITDFVDKQVPAITGSSTASNEIEVTPLEEQYWD